MIYHIYSKRFHAENLNQLIHKSSHRSAQLTGLILNLIVCPLLEFVVKLP